MLSRILGAIFDGIGRVLKALGRGVADLVQYRFSPEGRINRLMARQRQKTYRNMGYGPMLAALLSMRDEIKEGRLRSESEDEAE